MTRRKTSFSISLPSSKLTISYFYLQTLRYRHCWSWQYARRVSYGLRNAPSSPWSLCSSVLEHRSAESEGLRVDSSWGFRIFSLSHARDKTKNIFLDIEIVIRVIIRIMERNNFPAWCEIKNRLKKNNNGSQVPLTVNIL